MSSNVVGVEYGRYEGQVGVNAEACTEWLRQFGQSAHAPDTLLFLWPGMPTTDHDLSHISPGALQVNRTFTEYRHSIGRLDVFPDNISFDTWQDVLGESPGSWRGVASESGSHMVAQALAEIVEHTRLGKEGLLAENKREVRRFGLKKSVAPVIGTLALGAASFEAGKLAIEHDALPTLVIIMGTLLTAMAGLITTTRYFTKKVQKTIENNAFQTWPFQQRAKEKVKAYSQAYHDGQAPLLLEFNQNS